MSSHVTLSSERQDWQTPDWFLDLVRAVSSSGEIALDPATTVGNPTGARRFYAPAPMSLALDRPDGWLGPCGLAGDWDAPAHGGLTFVNPPYGAHLSGPIDPDYVHTKLDRSTGERRIVGVGRGWGRRIAQHYGETLALVPARTDTEWWSEMLDWADLVLLWRSPERGCRMSFINPGTGKPQTGSTVPNTVFYRAPMYQALAGLERFRAAFGGHGRIVDGGSSMREAA